MLRKSGFVFAVFALIFAMFAPNASAAEAPKLGGSGTDANYQVLRNKFNPDYCLANQHPRVFNFGGCRGQFNDQYWAWHGNLQIENLHHRGKCLAAHANGNVFTFDCAPGFRDTKWRNYAGIPGMIENVEHPGRCLAGHTNGRVFLADQCRSDFADQYWGNY